MNSSRNENEGPPANNARQEAGAPRLDSIDIDVDELSELMDALGCFNDDATIVPTRIMQPAQGSGASLLLPGPCTDPVTKQTQALLEELGAQEYASGRFELQSEIARGGMGVVWRAWDRLMGRAVAVKLLQQAYVNSDMMVRRFLTEARINGLLEHQGTIPVHSIGVLPSGQPFIAMRLVEGKTLQALLSERQNPTVDQMRFLKIFERVCHAIAYSHDRHIIHRDLKPENIIVGSYGVVKVTDWGLAKRLDHPEGSGFDFETMPAEVIEEDSCRFSESQSQIDMLNGTATSWGTIFGTLGYLPPEQARGLTDQIDKRADVFSLGAVLCEILTGSPPYTAQTSSALYRLAVKADLTDAIQRLNRCSAQNSLIELAIRCLSPEPNDRCQDATEVSALLTECLEADLRQKERELIRFFDLSLDLFCIAGLNGYFRQVNVNFSRVLGHSETDLISQPFMQFVHPDDHQPTIDAMSDLNEGRPVVRFQNRYRHLNGHYLQLEWTAQSVPEEGVIYAAARNVTEVH